MPIKVDTFVGDLARAARTAADAKKAGFTVLKRVNKGEYEKQ